MKRFTACILVFLMLLSLAACGESPTAPSSGSSPAEKLCSVIATDEPGLGSEWLAMAFYHNDFGQKSTWQKSYLKQLEADLQACGGVPGRKSTDFSSVVLGVTAAGGDARSIGGYDLTEKLNDAEFVEKQGTNSAAYALLALDCGNYASDCREEYISYLLSRRLNDGGFAVSGERADPDVTSMVIQALSRYSDRAEIADVIDDALSCLSALQREDGGYASWGTVNSESSAQVILALCASGVSIDDERFRKNGVSVMDDLLSYQSEDGAFSHEPGGEASAMAGVQALLALAAVERAASGERPFDFAA